MHHRSPRPPLTIAQILLWTDRHFARTGSWPTVASGRLLDAPGESWRNIYSALYHGLRGLPGGSSLAEVLAERRGVANRMALPRLTRQQILAWADSYRRATGKWPSQGSGPMADAPSEDWGNIDRALNRGDRGLPGGDSLAQLISRSRGVRHKHRILPLRIPQILHWADAHFRRYRQWPNSRSGLVVGALHETWNKIDSALKAGLRGLPGHGSLAKLLLEHRGVRNRAYLPPLTTKQILAWCDAHYERTGSWPKEDSGSIPDATSENWRAISQDLRQGHRGLAGGSSLAKLLESERGQRSRANRPRLTIKHILGWADDHHARTGKWPTHLAGRVLAEPTETWGGIHAALVNGHRGIRRRSSLAQLLAERRGYQHIGNRPRLSIDRILAWADAHHRRTGMWADAHFERTGRWPTQNSGPVAGVDRLTWSAVQSALVQGHPRDLCAVPQAPPGQRRRRPAPVGALPGHSRRVSEADQRPGFGAGHLTGFPWLSPERSAPGADLRHVCESNRAMHAPRSLALRYARGRAFAEGEPSGPKVPPRAPPPSPIPAWHATDDCPSRWLAHRRARASPRTPVFRPNLSITWPTTAPMATGLAVLRPDGRLAERRCDCLASRTLSRRRAASSSASVSTRHRRCRTLAANKPGTFRVPAARACSAIAKKFSRLDSVRRTCPAAQACSKRHASRVESVRSAGTMCRNDGFCSSVGPARNPGPAALAGFWFLSFRRSSRSLNRGGESSRRKSEGGGNRRPAAGGVQSRLTVTSGPYRFRYLCPTRSQRSTPAFTRAFRAAFTLRTSTPKTSAIQRALHVPVGRHSRSR